MDDEPTVEQLRELVSKLAMELEQRTVRLYLSLRFLALPVSK